MALSGFGGVLPFAYRHLVERRRWLTPEDFTKLLAASQVMPGPTICNLSVMFGYRSAGIGGAAIGRGRMTAPPARPLRRLRRAARGLGGHPAVRRGLTGL